MLRYNIISRVTMRMIAFIILFTYFIISDHLFLTLYLTRVDAPGDISLCLSFI